MREVGIVDVTTRDAHQSLWGTRMTTGMILPIAARMDEAGFHAIDVGSGALFDVQVRFLRENPWTRLRALRRAMPRSSLNCWLRGQSLFTFELFADDVVDLAIRRIAATGIDRLTTFDPLNDLRNVELSAAVAKQCGLHLTLALAYTLSPVHTDAYFAERAAQLVALGADEILLKDATGLLTPERADTLIPALVAAIGGRVPLQLHSHCRSGLAPQCYLRAIEHGVSIVHCASQPLANGASLPATEFVVRNGPAHAYRTAIDADVMRDMASYFTALAKAHDKPLGQPVEYDPALYRHQVPGGMISNLLLQLKTSGIEDKFEAILEEMARVRADLGYPVVVSPFAQFMVTQATLNVVQGERYRTIPDEIRKYAAGEYGRPAGPMDPEFLSRALDGRKVVTERPGACLPAALDAVRSKRGPFENDDDLLLAAFYSEAVLAPMRQAQESACAHERAGNPLMFLIRELASRRDVAHAEIGNRQGDRLQLTHERI
ncbi:MAG TPA: pyruvate carboxylase subunit B [Ramlibacter sp.]|uniref:pyruvate carboxylase subunit B n=1 Tax=Ramlibacter sp. TaxID=1917967 RepID=UPI002CDC1731|nr:pyruvate carboxylase subunit B [Ramlibacter sp.]HVZ42656.1 pyruvate carboxylase subunit B [Ramlibacter sp.]